MEIIRSQRALKDAIRGLGAIGKTIGLVPTMGALHAGHLSLVDIAAQHTDKVVVSIFVNPTQFGPGEDFSKYPRTETEDIKMLEKASVALVYIPTVEDMYPKGLTTRISVPTVASELEGEFRPGHFEGVATVVTELFAQSSPDVAVFGEKDYQQLHIIRQVARDLGIPVRIIGAPIMREADGLAMSSRNRYLSDKERRVAAALYRTLTETAAKIRGGKGSRETLVQAKEALLAAGFTKVDYVELRDAETLKPASDLKKPARLLAAAHLGTTRLIDNIAVGAEEL